MASKQNRGRLARATKTQTKPVADLIVEYETGRMSEEDAVAFFQHLLDTGMCWQLQGHYGRTAQALLNEGLISPPMDSSANACDARVQRNHEAQKAQQQYRVFCRCTLNGYSDVVAESGDKARLMVATAYESDYDGLEVTRVVELGVGTTEDPEQDTLAQPSFEATDD